MSEPTWIEDDPDPTGVRILLAAQPDPGPMPAAVSDRILGALAEVRRRADLDPQAGSVELGAELGLVGPVEDRDVDAGTESGSGSDSGPVPRAGRPIWGTPRGDRADSGSGRPRGLGRAQPIDGRDRIAENRRRWTILGSAAATIAALGLAGGLLSQQGLIRPSGSQGSVAGAAARPDPGLAPEKAASSVTDGAVTTALPDQRMSLQATSRNYTRDNVARLAQDLLDGPTRQTVRTGVSGVGPAVDVAQLSECVTTLGEAEADAVYADLATFEGVPGIVIVVVDNGLKEVYVVDRGCSKGSPGLLHGPVPMP